MQEQERVQPSIKKLFVPELKHKLKSAEQILMQREIEETKRKVTDLPVRRSAHLLQTESQQTESTILHQLVVLIQQNEFRQIVELHKHRMLQPAAVRQTRVDQQVRMTAEVPIELIAPLQHVA
jgi:hypothetical protein